jgi:hypothetical protein
MVETAMCFAAQVLEADYTRRRESYVVTVMRSRIVENKKAAQ